MLSSRGVFPFPSQADLDARYVRRFVGNDLAADTATIGGEPSLFNPSGPTMGRIPADVSTALIETNDGGRFGNRMVVLRPNSDARIIGSRFNGSFQAPTALLVNQTGATFEARGYDGVGLNRALAQLAGRARENVTPTAHGGEWIFSATRVGTTSIDSLFIVRSGGVGIAEQVGFAATMRMIPNTEGQLRNPSNSENRFAWDGTGLSFFNVPTVGRQLVPLGSTTDQVITALNSLGLFRLV